MRRTGFGESTPHERPGKGPRDGAGPLPESVEGMSWNERAHMGSRSTREPLSRATPIRPVSQKQGKLNAHRRALMAIWMDQAAEQSELGFAECEIKWDQGCTGRAVDGHERIKRGRQGSITDRTNVILCCRYCHEKTESEVEEATRRGFLASKPLA